VTGVSTITGETTAADDHQESDALADLRPLSSAIAVVHAYPGAAFAGRLERASRA
jgi:hypothetical protein